MTPAPPLATATGAALAGHRAQADAIRAAAERAREDLLTRTRAEAEQIIAARRASAARLADIEERERLVGARADARAIVLGAQRAVLMQATAAAHAAGSALRGDPRYRALMRRCRDDAQARLAGAGTVTIAEAPGGGIIARAGSREIDYSLPAQVDRCLRAMGTELTGLWR